MDIQIVRDLFTACLKSEKLLGKTNGISAEINKALLKLPTVKIGKNGTINEWYEDYKETEKGHRHISHLYGLYPANQITPETPKLYEAAKKTIERRLASGGGQTGWSRAWAVNFFARLKEGNVCTENINGLLAKQVSLNLFDLHPPRIFQIDGNLGITAGMAEMLVQSHTDVIEVLPALPDSWKNGSVSGLKARGGFEVDITWKNQIPTSIIITSNKGGKTNVRYKEQVFEIDIKAGQQKQLTLKQQTK